MHDILVELKHLHELAGNVVRKLEDYVDSRDTLDQKIASLDRRIVYYLKTRRNCVTKNGFFDSKRVEQSSRKVGD